MADVASIGHNRPPSQIESLTETCNAVGDWLKTNPVVETEEAARAAKPHVDRLRLGLQDMEGELKARTGPKLDEIDAIRGEYHQIRTLTEKLLEETRNRINAWAQEEKIRRRKFAEEVRQRAKEEERLAREAEETERGMVEDARLGVETDVAAATKEANERFAAFEKAQREVARAQRETKIKVGGGFGRAMTFHKETELFVTNPEKAINILGWSEPVLEVIRKEAVKYQRKHGHLPDGVFAKTTSRFR